MPDAPILAAKPSAGATAFFTRLLYSVAIPIAGGAEMEWSVFIYSWLVDFLLLMGVCRMRMSRLPIGRILAAPILNACCSALSLYFRLPFVSSPLFAAAVAVLTGIIAFGIREEGLWRCGLFLLLHTAVAGVAQPEWELRPWPLLLASILLLLFCALGYPANGADLIPVELSYGTNHISLTALRDTGNTLIDPVTGKPVLILSADAAQNLTGLTAQQLRSPVETMGSIPGLRLIPYRAIGGEGLLLALRLQNVRVGKRSGSGLVAFAPEVFSKEGRFQALTGGSI